MSLIGACVALAVPSTAQAAPGDIFVADPEAAGGNGAIFRIDPETGAQAIVSAGGKFEDPTGIGFDDTVGGGIAVVDPEAEGGPGAVFLVNPQSGAQSVVSSGGRFVNPVGIDASLGTFYDVTDPDAAPPSGPPGFGDGNVFIVDPDTGEQDDQRVEKVEMPFVDPTGVAGVAADYVADPNAGAGGGGALFAFTQECAGPMCITSIPVQRAVSSGGSFSDPVGVALAPLHLPGPLVVDRSAFGGSGAIFGIGSGGSQVTLTRGGSLAEPRDVVHYPATAAGSPARLLVADRDAAGGSGAVLAVDPTTGAQTVLSSGGGFVDPSGIAVDLPFCFGGDEDLTVLGTGGPDTLGETPGIEDVIAALAGDDLVEGDPNESGKDVDVICGGDGDDVVDGGTGREFAFGDSGADRLEGNRADDELEGDLGGDVLIGGRGSDYLLGGEDPIAEPTGVDGADALKGGKGRDRLNGWSGKDKLNGGKGRDEFEGGKGKDRLMARDGSRDNVDCGKGRDTAIVDREDKVSRCERVKRR